MKDMKTKKSITTTMGSRGPRWLASYGRRRPFEAPYDLLERLHPRWQGLGGLFLPPTSRRPPAHASPKWTSTRARFRSAWVAKVEATGTSKGHISKLQSPHIITILK